MQEDRIARITAADDDLLMWSMDPAQNFPKKVLAPRDFRSLMR